ncbi:DUF503 domain-containing protein [Bacillus alkalicellulosilyticus]|uniref:DUF503 domain-containing protein n=1 Tax=Alkalihalobacterium alkalicellulosilyticum TaxID=1912214 RepID=UPI000998A7ED|nr:DUF503 family protein [Bacillus alkalicellulosilyticus]
MIGAVDCELFLYTPQSLKEKRAIVKSIIMKLRQRLNVSVSETNHQDVWQRCQLTIVAVTSNKVATEKELSRALALIDSTPEIERTVTNFEWF